ncbi:hypothetical protein WR25_25797 [Diploscapter pachys]|uniref:aralkylamine N-acetyltransferase n=1 Tax=Diploscapter pachys TaxID=2018661 RepID=A0A2A2JHF5_9BILA|nr:hypothetical protein WR25_25797 [Diploscapter pachys]
MDLEPKDFDVSQLGFNDAKPSDKDEIMHYLITYFRHDEPNLRALQFSEDEFRPMAELIVDKSLATPFSTIVRYQGEIVALMINSLWRRADKTEDGYSENMNEKPILGRMLDDCHDKFWKLVPETVNTVVYREIGSVRRDFRRKGIARKLIFCGITPENIQKYDIGGIVAVNSSFAQQANLRKAGFIALNTIYHKDYKDENGQQYYQTDDGTDKMILNFMPTETYLEKLKEQK